MPIAILHANQFGEYGWLSLGEREGNDRLVAVDLFAGAGGFSEGFRQAGIDVSVAYDKWAAACSTHERNHPFTQTRKCDILNLPAEAISADAPRIDILFGSPPCTEFSGSKNGGKGNIEEGLAGVFHFLRLVHELRPRYWVMENVPRLRRFFDEHLEGDAEPFAIPLRRLGVDSDASLEIPILAELNARWFGVPQKRKRLFIGNFPLPEEANALPARPGEKVLADVLQSFPDPTSQPDGTLVRDPLYQQELVAIALEDHFGMPVELLLPDEVDEIRRLKQDHPYYGLIDFPDLLDHPARTILARQNRIAREAIYVPAPGLPGEVRRLTPREMASLMGFPVTYQFFGNTDRARRTLIGNAVCPPVARSIAEAIIRDTGREPGPLTLHRPLAFPAPGSLSTFRRFKDNRVFKQHPPGTKMGTRRVDIENYTDEMTLDIPRHPLAPDRRHLAGWKSVIHVGIGKYTHLTVDWKTAVHEFTEVAYRDYLTRMAAERFLEAVGNELPLITPDATTLHARWSRKITDDCLRPESWLRHLTDLVDASFPVAGVGQRQVKTHSLLFDKQQVMMSIRVLATLVACSFACECANRGTAWILSNPEQYYWPYSEERPDIDQEGAARAARTLSDRFVEACAAAQEAALREELSSPAMESTLQPALGLWSEAIQSQQLDGAHH